MTITIGNLRQLNAVMAAIGLASDERHAEAPHTGPDKKIEAKSKAAHKEDTRTIAEADARVQKPEAITQMTACDAEKALHGHANAPVDAPTYQDAKDAVIRLARDRGKDAAVAVLSEFGVTKLPEVKPEQFADVIAACEKAGA